MRERSFNFLYLSPFCWISASRVSIVDSVLLEARNKGRKKERLVSARFHRRTEKRNQGNCRVTSMKNSESRRRSVQKKGAMRGLLITGRAGEHAHPCTPMKGALVLPTSRSHRSRNYKGQQLQWDGSVSCIVLTLMGRCDCMKYTCKRTQTYNPNACDTHMLH